MHATRKIIFLLDLSESFSRNLIQGISRYADIYGPWSFCKMTPSYRDQYGIEGIIEFAREWKADCLVGQFQDENEVKQLIEAGLKLIAVDYIEPFDTIANISGNYRKSGEMAADYFLSRGFKNFAFYGMPNTVWSRERENAFRKKIQAVGLSVNSYSPDASKNRQFWFYTASTLKDWLLSLPKPVAIFTCDDNRAEHLMEAAKMAKIHIPEEMALLSVDNDELICKTSTPSLSSIQQDEINGGFLAAELMEKMIQEHRIIKQDILLEPLQIITRHSSDVFALDDPYIKKALIYIKEHLDTPLNVTEICRQIPLSRRALEIRFKNQLNRSIYEEVKRQRMEKFVFLLLNSDLPINDMATLCGFPDSKNLARVFASQFAMSPSVYRKRFSFNKI
ncbi:MAG: DNA-binding transcriptional regulator [Saprospiraceae bacterium]|nr:DNA-binding transcriptional regulator [Saprospiraceae bacterium]